MFTLNAGNFSKPHECQTLPALRCFVFKRYDNHPTFDRNKINKARDEIAQIVGKDLSDVEDTEVWGIAQLFNSWGQTRYFMNETTGKIDKNNVTDPGIS